MHAQEPARFRFLQWATALRALPPGGLQEHNDRITLKCVQGDDTWLPVAHTCSRVLDLPDYSSREVLEQNLLFAMQQTDGFHVN